MYIQLKNDPASPVKMSRKLFKSMNFPKGKSPWFIQIVQIKGTNEFAMVRKENADTFKTQCTMVTPTRDKRHPACFHWTIPSIEYFVGVTGISLITGAILKVKEENANGVKYWRICNK